MNKIQMRRWAKTNIYLNAIINFLISYEQLRELLFLRHLRDKKKLCLVVLPSDTYSNPYSSQYSLRYFEFLTENVPNFLAVESEADNNGYLYRPFDKSVSREEVDDDTKLRAIERLCECYGFTDIYLFGSNINQCVLTTERGFELCGLERATVLVDVSVSSPNEIYRAFLKYGVKSVVESMGEGRYVEFCGLINHLLENPVDFVGLKLAIGRVPEEQLLIFERYQSLVHTLNKLKELCSYEHQNIGFSGFSTLE